TCGLIDLLRGGDGLEHDDEFIAAHAYDDVVRAGRGANPLRHGLQQLVAGLVTAGVVDVLEAIEIEKEHREHGAAALRLVDRTRQRTVMSRAIRAKRLRPPASSR